MLNFTRLNRLLSLVKTHTHTHTHVYMHLPHMHTPGILLLLNFDISPLLRQHPGKATA